MHDLFTFHNFSIQHLKSYICLQTHTQQIEADDNELYTYCFTEKFQEGHCSSHIGNDTSMQDILSHYLFPYLFETFPP